MLLDGSSLWAAFRLGGKGCGDVTGDVRVWLCGGAPIRRRAFTNSELLLRDRSADAGCVQILY